jgi:hypothetical protein
MVELYGQRFKKRELLKRVGDMSQIAGARLSELQSGKAKGVTAVDVRTGSGFSFTVLPSRCLDISWAGYKEFPLSYVSPTSVVAPEYFVERGNKGFLDNFFAGLLTTCGFTHFGTPSTDNGKELGLHGVAGNIPAEDLSIRNEWEGDEYIMSVRGKMRQSSFLGENIVLTREIRTTCGANSVTIHDEIENVGFIEQPFMLLYHSQFGYPIVSEHSRLSLPPGNIQPRTDESKKGLDTFSIFQEPTA